MSDVDNEPDESFEKWVVRSSKHEIANALYRLRAENSRLIAALKAIDEWRPKGGGFDDSDDNPYLAMAVACKEIARAALTGAPDER